MAKNSYPKNEVKNYNKKTNDKYKIEVEKENLETIEINEIKGTPFASIKLKNGKYAVVCGKTKLNTEFEDIDKVHKYVKSKPYEMIGLLIEAFFNYYQQNLNNKNN